MLPRRLFTIALGMMLTLGCAKRDLTNLSAFDEDSSEYILLIAVDLSGSFLPLMADDGVAYDFVQRALDKYFHDRAGNQDRIVITQLSGNNEPMIWQGSPHDLRRQFATPADFKKFLHKKADPNSSRINDGIADSLEYVLKDYSVVHYSAKVVALVLSDMGDNHPDMEASERRLQQALAAFSKHGELGFYFCPQSRLSSLHAQLKNAGFRKYVVEPDFHRRPPLPNFE